MKQYLIGICIKAGHQTMCDNIVAVVVMTVELHTAARKKKIKPKYYSWRLQHFPI